MTRVAGELSGSSSAIERLNRGPKHQIATEKLRALGMTFGGKQRLRQTVAELIAARRGANAG
ncbi:MAG: hypothetical protein ACK4RK_06280 [Gemmataceae bacterium]